MKKLNILIVLVFVVCAVCNPVKAEVRTTAQPNECPTFPPVQP